MTENKKIFLPILITAIICVITSALFALVSHTDPVEMDTVSYLSEAYKVRQSGGIFTMIPNMLSGKYTQATQHPLYIALISLGADKSLEAFVFAKKISLLGGIFLIFALWYAAGKVFGKWTACFTLLFTVSSATFLRLTSMVACESYLPIFWVLFWVFTVLGFKTPKYWLFAGLSAGAMFLTKSIGILCVGIFVLSALIIKRKEIKTLLTSKPFWSFFLGFILITSPLLIRNIVVFNAPLYSDSSSVLWADDWHDWSRERALEGRFGPMQYLESHSFSEIASTFTDGIIKRDVKMITDGLKPYAFLGEINGSSLTGFHKQTVGWQGQWAFILCMLFICSLYRRRKEPVFIISLISAVVYMSFCGWFSKIFDLSPPTRIMYPLIFLIWIHASDSILFLLSKLAERIQLKPNPKIGLIFFVIFFSVQTACSAKALLASEISINKSWKLNPIAMLQLNWVKQHAKPGDHVLLGEVLSTYQFYLDNDYHFTAYAWPKKDNLKELAEFIVQNRIKFGVLDLAAALHNRQLFGAYYRFGPKIGMRLMRPLPGFFQRVNKDPRLPPLFDIFVFKYGNNADS